MLRQQKRDKKRSQSKSGLNKDKNQKLRTPRGQALTRSVKDIRNFFSEQALISGETSPSGQSSITSVLDEIKDNSSPVVADRENEWQIVRGDKVQKHQQTRSKVPKQTLVSKLTTKDGLMKDNRFAYLKASEDQSSIESELDIDDNSAIKYKLSNPAGANAMYDQSEMNQDSSDQQTYIKAHNFNMIANSIIEMAKQQEEVPNTDKNSSDDPLTIDVRTVIKMFNNLQLKLDNKTEKEADGVVAKLQKEMNLYKRKAQVMTSVVQRLGEIVNGVEAKMDMMEARNMR